MLRPSTLMRLYIPTLTKQFQPLSRTRTPFGATRSLHQFVVYAPDYTDEGAIQRRLQVRRKHMDAAEALHGAGVMNIGGAILSSDGLEASEPASKIIGSMFIVRAESLAEARKRVEADLYWTGNVWDKERIVIQPFLQAPFTFK